MPNNQQKVTSSDIKLALSKKHDARHDFFMCECKTGPTLPGLLIFDGLAIAKSWANPCITGYEIKVSRSDFKRDAKYREYLPYCHKFSFVVPTGLVDRAEVETDIGLIYYNPATGNLTTKRAAPYREIDVPASMLMYIIMNRLENDRHPFYSTDADYWRAWLENKVVDRELGYKVKGALGKELRELRDLTRWSNRYKEEVEEYQNIIFKIAELLSPYHTGHISYHNVLDVLPKILSSARPTCLDEAEKVLQQALIAVQKIVGKEVSQ